MNFIKKYIWMTILSSILFTFSFTFSKVHPIFPIPHSHAHNDYNNEHPLIDALFYGFKSIEIDIFLMTNDLYVAHSITDIRPGYTLKTLYLDPLDKHINNNNGWVYKDSTQLILLIDIKSLSEATYKKLCLELSEYTNIIHINGVDKLEQKPVLVIISGNRPKHIMHKETIRFAAYNCWIEDLDSSVSINLMPMISERWDRLCKWNGEGEMPLNEKLKLKQIVKMAHNAGR